MSWDNLLLRFFLYYISAACFDILLSIPKCAYHTVGMAGGGVWVVYWMVCYCSGIDLVSSNLVTAILISISSQAAVCRKRAPIIVFSVSVLIPLMPGGQAYKMVRNFAIGNYHLVNVHFYQVAVIVDTITLGLDLGEFLNRVLNYLHKYLIKRSRWNF